jgi:hypothetical protein
LPCCDHSQRFEENKAAKPQSWGLIMRVLLLAVTAGLALAACASGGSDPAPAPTSQDRSLQERAAAVTAPVGRPPESTPGEVAAEAQADPPPPAPTDPDTLVVPGERDPLPTPPGDPRTTEQRMTDIRAWDRCILRAQSQMTDGQPGRLQESPEEICRRALGMRDRMSIPYRD